MIFFLRGRMLARGVLSFQGPPSRVLGHTYATKTKASGAKKYLRPKAKGKQKPKVAPEHGEITPAMYEQLTKSVMEAIEKAQASGDWEEERQKFEQGGCCSTFKEAVQKEHPGCLCALYV